MIDNTITNLYGTIPSSYYVTESIRPLSYRLCVKKGGIIVLQGKFLSVDSHGYRTESWRDLPTVYEENNIGPITAS